MLELILDIVVAGLLLGGIYALIAVGFSLQYGVARVLNIGHGEFIMIGAFVTWWLYTEVGVNPMLSLGLAGSGAMLIGYVLHRTLFRSLARKAESPGAFEGNSMLASFGMLFIIQNGLILIWGADIHKYAFLDFAVSLGGTKFAGNRLLTLGLALLIGLAFYLFLARTRLGKAIRGAAQDPDTAGLMGVNINQVLALCFGLGAMMAALAGVLLSMSYPIKATDGLEYTIIAMIVVVLGGLGSIPGSFIGGFILGMIGAIVTHFEPSLYVVAYYLIFVVLLLVRPKGILGK